MQKLCVIPIAWQNVPLDKLNNQSLLMLSGMVTDEHRKLVRAETEGGQKYPGCDCTVNTGQTTNTTIHRITNCTKYKSDREALFGMDIEDQVDKNARKTNMIIIGVEKSISTLRLIKGITRIAI